MSTDPVPAIRQLQLQQQLHTQAIVALLEGRLDGVDGVLGILKQLDPELDVHPKDQLAHCLETSWSPM